MIWNPSPPRGLGPHLAATLLLTVVTILGLGACDAAPADGTAGEVPGDASAPTAEGLPSHETFTRILDEVVHMPRVDYARLQEERQLLDAYLAELAAVSPATLEASSTEDRLAFWLNAYNACMLKLVVDHYPIQPGGVGLFGFLRNRVAGYPDNSVWQIRDVFSRDHCRVAGANRSQDEIEHEIIRPRFQEPRIHFAVNCAAVSCPVLWPEAYVPRRLEEQLDRAVEYLMADPEHFRLEAGPPPVLRLNKVMDWYSEDFGGPEGLKAFFADHLEGEEFELVQAPETRVEFFEYDWTLNDVPR
jgi:hypothetical protein